MAPKDVDRFLLLVVDVERRATLWCDLDDEVQQLAVSGQRLCIELRP